LEIDYLRLKGDCLILKNRDPDLEIEIGQVLLVSEIPETADGQSEEQRESDYGLHGAPGVNYLITSKHWSQKRTQKCFAAFWETFGR
jgi:hypothetical protein